MIPLLRSFPIEDLRSIRAENSISEEKKVILFNKMYKLMSVNKAVNQIEEYDNPKIVLWFTNYFGSVMKSTYEWYQNNVFKKIPKAQFWLADLKAWALLAVNKEQLKKNYPSLVKNIEAIPENKTMDGAQDMSQSEKIAVECPLITSSSTTIDNDLSQVAGYKPLISKDFFKWLLQIENRSLLSDDVCEQLCKESSNKDRLSFSLADIGYKPSLLNRSLKKLNGKTMLQDDVGKIYRILQYLEGIYYAKKIIEDTAEKKDKKCSIVFMLPNKEFTYYTVPQEKSLFENFKKSIEVAIQPIISKMDIHIRFQPFAYGEAPDFSDMPYKCKGNGGGRFAKTKLIKALSNLKENA